MARWTDKLSKNYQMRRGPAKELTPAQKQLAEATKRPKDARHKSTSTECNLKHRHMSRGEARCCDYFQFLEIQGLLKILKVQPNVFLTDAKLKVIPDWLLEYPGGDLRYADYKGLESQSWGRNKKLWKFYGPAPMEVWKSKGDRFFVTETIRGGNS